MVKIMKTMCVISVELLTWPMLNRPLRYVGKPVVPFRIFSTIVIEGVIVTENVFEIDQLVWYLHRPKFTL